MRSIDNPMQYEDFSKFVSICEEEAALPFCNFCGGTGEVWERKYWDEAQEDLIQCPHCDGRGVIG